MILMISDIISLTAQICVTDDGNIVATSEPDHLNDPESQVIS